MLINLALGMVFMLATVVIHSGAMILVMRRFRDFSGDARETTIWDEIGQVSRVILITFFATMFEVAIWAAGYVAVQAIDSFEKALYFSMVTFTTLGYGDITLSENWRLLSAIQAGNGIVMFGWTTALVIAVVQHIYQRHDQQ